MLGSCQCLVEHEVFPHNSTFPSQRIYILVGGHTGLSGAVSRKRQPQYVGKSSTSGLPYGLP